MDFLGLQVRLIERFSLVVAQTTRNHASACFGGFIDTAASQESNPQEPL